MHMEAVLLFRKAYENEGEEAIQKMLYLQMNQE